MVTNNYNDNTAGGDSPGAGSGVVDDPKEVGGNCELQLSDGTEVAVTNVSFSEEANTSEVQYTSGFHQSIAVTGVSYSGSFEISGNAQSMRAEGWANGQPEAGETSLPQSVGSMTIVDGEGNEYTFNNVLLNSHSKDIPSDDRTTQSFDFMAERLVGPN
jgi:hypothetical protein